MPSCLGLYVEKKLIKYAKVSKDHDVLKVEAFGIKFYDKLYESIQTIISETYSYKTPISINLSEEMYTEFYMFNLLNNKDLAKAIKTEFGSFCYDKDLNENAFESRYALVNSLEDKDKIKVLNVYASKMEINKKMQTLEGNKVTTIAPLPMAIANIADLEKKENVAIINIEEKTTITMVVGGKVYQIKTIDSGTKEILDNINMKENSYAKSYQICKNTTIYTMEGKELQDEEENNHLEDIIPTLFDIATKAKGIFNESLQKMDKVYLTGTATVINNIDLYFQEFLPEAKCEILKPYFITNNVKINMKDYIEVNSAIGLALQGLGYGIKSMNFKTNTISDKLKDFVTVEPKNTKNKHTNINFSFLKNDLGEKLTPSERWMARTVGGILALTIIYSGFSIFLNNGMQKKNSELEENIKYTTAQIETATKDIDKIKSRANQYQRLLSEIENNQKENIEKYKSKNEIPILLSELMSVMPKGVQLTSIEVSPSKEVKIQAQSTQYEQLGYLKVKIKSDAILKPDKVKSSQGVKDGNIIKVTIEGELP